jgi:tetratricopeptide (TPR) repeat protein
MKSRNLLAALILVLLPVSSFSQSAKVPLTRAEILGRLAWGQSPSQIAHSVKIRGIGFSISEDFLSAVRLAGGRGILVERLSATDPTSSVQAISDSGRPFDHLAKCAESLHAGNSEQAEKECRASVDQNPESPWPLLTAAWVLDNNNIAREEEAGLLRRAVALAPNLAEAHQMLSAVLFGTAESSAESAKASALENQDQLDDLGQVTVRFYGGSLGDETQIDPGLQHLLQTEPDLAATHILLAIRCLQLGNLDKGVGEYKEALRLEPDNPELHEAFARLYESQQDVEDGIAELRETVRIVP